MSLVTTTLLTLSQEFLGIWVLVNERNSILHITDLSEEIILVLEVVDGKVDHVIVIAENTDGQDGSQVSQVPVEPSVHRTLTTLVVLQISDGY